MKILIKFLLLMTVLSGCTTIHIIKDSDVPATEINDALSDRETTILLTNGYDYTATHVHIDNDSLSFNSALSDSRMTVPFSDVTRITRTNTAGGTALGMAIGSAVGVGFAYLFLEVTETERSAEGEVAKTFNTLGRSLIYTSFGFVGAFTGMAVGLVGGKNLEYHIKHGRPDLKDSDYFTLRISILIEETADAIRFRWRGKEVILLKSDIHQIDHTKQPLQIKVSKKTYQQKLSQ